MDTVICDFVFFMIEKRVSVKNSINSFSLESHDDSVEESLNDSFVLTYATGYRMHCFEKRYTRSPCISKSIESKIHRNLNDVWIFGLSKSDRMTIWIVGEMTIKTCHLSLKFTM